MRKIIEIGSRELITMTEEELLKIASIEQCISSLDYWNEPLITDFNNDMFSDTIFIEYFSTKKSNGAAGDKICFFFNFKKFTFDYTRNYPERNNVNVRNLSMQTIKYIIQQNFDIPIY